MARGDHTGERPIGPAAAGGGRAKKGGAYDPTGASCQRAGGSGARQPHARNQVGGPTFACVAGVGRDGHRGGRHARQQLHTACQTTPQIRTRVLLEKTPVRGDRFAGCGRRPRSREPRTARSVSQRRAAFCGAAPGAPDNRTAAKTSEIRPRLDVPGGRALVCGVSDAGHDPFPGASRRASCQRSFNWQSTAFVMRGLRVRLPPLAVRKPDDIAGDSPPHGNSSPPRHP